MTLQRGLHAHNLTSISVPTFLGIESRKGNNIPMRLGTKRKTFSEYDCAVARSTATFASTTPIEALRCRLYAVVVAIARVVNPIKLKFLSPYSKSRKGGKKVEECRRGRTEMFRIRKRQAGTPEHQKLDIDTLAVCLSHAPGCQIREQSGSKKGEDTELTSMSVGACIYKAELPTN